jgi:hypothetical protein
MYSHVCATPTTQDLYSASARQGTAQVLAWNLDRRHDHQHTNAGRIAPPSLRPHPEGGGRPVCRPVAGRRAATADALAGRQ